MHFWQTQFSRFTTIQALPQLQYPDFVEIENAFVNTQAESDNSFPKSLPLANHFVQWCAAAARLASSCLHSSTATYESWNPEGSGQRGRQLLLNIKATSLDYT